MYDGREKPPFKRGKAVSGRSYGNAPIIRLSKTLIDLFKFPRHDAPGEAEAECAWLQRVGVVDAVMSNDVDTLMFGSTTAVMNFSKENGSGTSAATHVTRYQMGNQGCSSSVELDRAGMILFAMLSGGDYLPSGVPKCGSKLAAEIAKAGFGADLLDLLDSDGPELDMKLGEWRDRLQYELEENESGYFQTKHKAVRIPETFPDRTILSYYARPVVSKSQEVQSLRNRLVDAWDREVDALEIRRFAADTFDWNYRSGARKIIRLLAEPLVSYRLRLGRQPSAFPPGVSLTSDDNVQMVQKIYRSRTSFATDGLSELQLDMVPIDVVGLDVMAEEPNPPLSTPITSQETVDLNEDEEDDGPAESVQQSPTKKRVTKPFDPYATEKVWVFETIAEKGIPDIVRRWHKEQAEKASAVKKTSTRKNGPKKKGPIDPGMKHGSLLRYGTLTKERSEIPQYKQAHLFDAALSTPPNSSQPSSQSYRSSPTMFQGKSSFRHMNVQQHYPTIVPRADLDGLADIFSSYCAISPGVKRLPRAQQHRVRSPGAVMTSRSVEMESLGLPNDTLECLFPTPQTRFRKIKMSYSRKDYPGFDANEAANSPSRLKRDRKVTTQPDLESQEVEALKASMVSLSLSRFDTEENAITSSTPMPKDQSPKTARKPTAAEDKPAQTPHHNDIHLSIPNSQDTQTPKPKPKSKSTRTSNAPPTPKPNPPSQHIESVTAHNGFWSVDPASTGESEPALQDTVAEKTPTRNRGEKKKRIPRVSILDMS